MPEKSITLSIKRNLENAVLLSTVVQSVGMTLPFSQTDACMLRFCSLEAVKLALKGYPAEHNKPIIVTLDILEDRLRLIVSDLGQSVDFLNSCTPDLSVEDIVKAVDDDCVGPEVIQNFMDSVDSVSVDGDNKLVMSKKFNTSLGEYQE
ncbi:MAG: ATP-binding protein [Desulfonatronovibrio sp.]|nr:ATP-binding protein [Desulfovibrionales bacterium]